MSKPDSNSSKVLISNPVIGFIIVTLIAGSLFYIYLIHTHLANLQSYKTAIMRWVKTTTEAQQTFREQYFKFNHGLYTLSEVSEEYLQTSLENQALMQYTQCKSETNAMLEAISHTTATGIASLKNLRWNSAEIFFELHTSNEDKLFSLLRRIKSKNPDHILHIDGVSHIGDKNNEYSVVIGRLTQENCTGGQS